MPKPTYKTPKPTRATPSLRAAQGMAYLPRHGSVPDQVCRFFAANPDELLDTAAIEVKFKCRMNNVHTSLSDCVATQLLNRTRDHDVGYLYSAGPRLASSAYAALAASEARDQSGMLGGRLPGQDATDTQAAQAAKALAPGKRPTNRRAPFEHPAPESLVIRTDVPPPANMRGGLCAPDYKPKLLAMPIASCIDFPVRSRHIIGKQMTELHKKAAADAKLPQAANEPMTIPARWRAAQVDTGTLRVWRVA